MSSTKIIGGDYVIGRVHSKSGDVEVYDAHSGKRYGSYPMSSGWTVESALADAREETPGTEFVAEIATTTVYR